MVSLESWQIAEGAQTGLEERSPRDRLEAEVGVATIDETTKILSRDEERNCVQDGV